MARYPQSMVVTRAETAVAAGSMINGVWVPTSGVNPVAVYTGAVDVQDTPLALARDADGLSTITADAIAFLPRGVQASQFQPEDYVVITWQDGTTDDARVMETRRLDDRLALEWL